MTTDSRDLDRACAEAMGWTSVIDGVYKGELIGSKPGRDEAYILPRYSTDPSTQAEKFAIWDADEELGGVTLWQDWSGKKCTWTARIGECAGGAVQRHLREGGEREQRFWEATGATIDEALAHLVCAVAKAKKEQGK